MLDVLSKTTITEPWINSSAVYWPLTTEASMWCEIGIEIEEAYKTTILRSVDDTLLLFLVVEIGYEAFLYSPSVLLYMTLFSSILN